MMMVRDDDDADDDEDASDAEGNEVAVLARLIACSIGRLHLIFTSLGLI